MYGEERRERELGDGWKEGKGPMYGDGWKLGDELWWRGGGWREG